MSQENVEVVRRLYEAYAAHDFQTALDLIAPDIEWDLSMRPDGKVYRGREGAIEAVRTWTGTWEAFSFELEELIDAGDQVVVIDRQSGRGKGSGMPLEESFAVVYTVEAGKVTRAVWFTNREDALAASGLERG
jgi:hypothetical protein